ncbi:MAG TPA: preprotein translocase subunit SecE [Terriglobales bacterium]|nr:preprotein translocase subunit SecE [Terriglobales bacterium]
MSKLAAVGTENNLGARVASWPEKVKTFYSDVRMEMKKVTTPSLKEVQATTVVVVITVFIFGLYFWLVDFVIGRGIDYMFRFFSRS